MLFRESAGLLFTVSIIFIQLCAPAPNSAPNAPTHGSAPSIASLLSASNDSMSILSRTSNSSDDALFEEEAVEAQTTLGPVRGIIVRAGGAVAEVFNSIPYAMPPIGGRRYEEPERPEPWERPVDTSKIIECWQFDEIDADPVPYSEDCLYFKLVIPLDENGERFEERLPVVLWLHGGSYNTFSKELYSHEGIVEHFSSKKIIFIAPNYRIGVFGFLTALHADLPGNYGMDDILLMLNLLHENADNWGIDTSRVTVAGESAGAAAASILAVSPRSAGLIHSAILVSGSSQANWAVRSHSSELSSALFINACHCNRSTVAEIKRCMQKATTDCLNERFQEVMKHHEKSWYETLRMGIALVTPVVDPYRIEKSIIPQRIEHLVKHGARMPIMISGTSHERIGSLPFLKIERDKLLNIMTDDQAFSAFQSKIDSLVSNNRPSKKFVVKAIRQRYFPASGITDDIIYNITTLLSDDNVAAHYEEALLYSGRGQTVYLLENQVQANASGETMHCMDMDLLFNSTRFTGGCDQCDPEASRPWILKFAHLLTEFITTRKIDELQPFTPNQRNAYLLNVNGTKLKDYHTQEYYFWRQTVPALESLAIFDTIPLMLDNCEECRKQFDSLMMLAVGLLAFFVMFTVSLLYGLTCCFMSRRCSKRQKVVEVVNGEATPNK